MDSSNARREIARNGAVHDRVARKYASHGEIFNWVERARLHEALRRAVAAVRRRAAPVRALDFGCGYGNFGLYLLGFGIGVAAADVSSGFVDVVRARYPNERLTTHLIPGGSLAGAGDASFNLIAAFSIFHHFPDYLAAVAEIASICKRRGVIMIEATGESGLGDLDYRKMQRVGLRFDWGKNLSPANYFHRDRRLFNPSRSNEGDIHVWPDNYIEWTKIKALLAGAGFEVDIEENYLVSRNLCPPEVYTRFGGRYNDTKKILHKCAA